MEIIRAFVVDTFMDDKEFSVFLWNKRMPTVRAFELKDLGNLFTGNEGLTTDFALILAVSTIVIVNIMMRGTTTRTSGIIGD